MKIVLIKNGAITADEVNKITQIYSGQSNCPNESVKNTFINMDVKEIEIPDKEE